MTREEMHTHHHDHEHEHDHGEVQDAPHDPAHGRDNISGHDPQALGRDELHDHGRDLELSPDHEQPHDHEQVHREGLFGRLQNLIGAHSHSYEELAHDEVLRADERGIRALKLSLGILLATATAQAAVVALSRSVALLADMIHNYGDALTALPLWLAFSLGRRRVNRRFTYGYGRAEDLAGVVIVLIILFSALTAIYQAYDRLIHPRPLENLIWVAVASVIGFVGNEVVAVLRIRVGRQIGSAALVADGYHARTDGITSLGVLLGAIGVWLGFPEADPIVGALIGITILFIVKDTAVSIWYRMMDAVDPALVERVEHNVRQVAGVQNVEHVRARWLGHNLWLEANIIVDGTLTTAESHQVAENVRHTLFHQVAHVGEVVVHVDPSTGDGQEHHALTTDHGLPALRE